MITLKLRIAFSSPNPSESRDRCIGIVALEGLKGQSILVIASKARKGREALRWIEEARPKVAGGKWTIRRGVPSAATP